MPDSNEASFNFLRAIAEKDASKETSLWQEIGKPALFGADIGTALIKRMNRIRKAEETQEGIRQFLGGVSGQGTQQVLDPVSGTVAKDYYDAFGGTPPEKHPKIGIPAQQPAAVTGKPSSMRMTKFSLNYGDTKLDYEIDSGATAVYESVYQEHLKAYTADGIAPDVAEQQANKAAYVAAALVGPSRIDPEVMRKFGFNDNQMQGITTAEIGKLLKAGYKPAVIRQLMEGQGFIRSPAQWRDAFQFAYDMSITAELSEYLDKAQAAEESQDPERHKVFAQAEDAYNAAKARVDERFGRLPTGTSMYDDQNAGVQQQLLRIGNYGPGTAIPKGDLITAQGLAEKHALGLSAKQKSQQQQAIMAQKLRSAEFAIKHLRSISAGVHTADPGLVNRLWQGGKLAIGMLSEENVEAAKYNKEKMGFMRFIARAFGEVGVLTKQDIQEMARMFPSILTTRDLASGLFDDIQTLMSDIAGRKPVETKDAFSSQDEALSYINELGEEHFTNNSQFQEDVRLLLEKGPPETNSGEIGAINNSPLFQ